MSQTLFQQDNIHYDPDFLLSTESQKLFAILKESLNWQEETIKLYGKLVKVPRLVCWYGDDDVEYRYSGVNHVGLPWTDELFQLKTNIEKYTGNSFNSVLGNLYRNESDSMGWHSDNEKELGSTPCIASISLGEERLFKIRHRQSGETFGENLASGSLLVMSGNFQNEWQHSVPKEKTVRGPRINLTFRQIFT